MACSLNSISKIDDLARIRAVLLPHLLESIADNDYQTTDTDLTEDDEMPSKMNPFAEIRVFLLYIFVASESVARAAVILSTYERKSKKASSSRYQWLRDCQLAFSPTLNLLVIGFDQHIVVSTG